MFVATKMILVAAPANDNIQLFLVSTCAEIRQCLVHLRGVGSTCTCPIFEKREPITTGGELPGNSETLVRAS